MEHEDVDLLAVDVEGGGDGGRELAHGTGEQVVGRLENREFGEQRGAPGVLVGAWAVVDVHSKVLGKELRGVAVAHDDALQVGFEQTYHVQLELLDKVAHAVLGRPHVIVEGEVNGPDTGRHDAVFRVVRLVVIGREAHEGGGQEDDVDKGGCDGVVLLVLRRGCTAGIAAAGLRGGEVEDTGSDEDECGHHDPISVLTNKGATRDKCVGDDPDVEQHHEVVDEESETECRARASLGGGRKERHRQTH